MDVEIIKLKLFFDKLQFDPMCLNRLIIRLGLKFEDPEIEAKYLSRGEITEKFLLAVLQIIILVTNGPTGVLVFISDLPKLYRYLGLFEALVTVLPLVFIRWPKIYKKILTISFCYIGFY